ncbi:hypothetical protein IV203_034919 [Nitzschia inconspicua]|uniref:MCM10 OB-fold domain-containing protein n=1 Tax=Nitzschia inconspicua TaxID=303405 RepID=A0A9K3LF85_9STRA|nr:hypothetical protein IV203_034919 [Nitzschia inconspicua]
MDELLELMEDSSSAQEKTVNASDGMDELAFLLGRDDDKEKEKYETRQQRSSSPTPTSSSTHRQSATCSKTKPVVTPSNTNSVSSQLKGSSKARPTVEASVDDRLGIRMLNRLVSSADLLELITDHPYFAPATLSAMPLAKLNTLLLDPARIVDPATVAGKTNLVTVGMVFSNSGTRISSKGGAFCVLTIGNFASGPCVTIFLFGDVYGKYCRTCTPGKVVAVMGPKLLPSNRKDGNNNKSSQYSSNSNDCAVAFSVFDRGQLQLVATARDYGTCQGKVRVKQQDGTWSNTGTCKSYVDKRVSDFCSHHRRQQHSGTVPVSGKFQQLKQQQQANAFRAPSVLVQSKPRAEVVQGGSNRFLNPTSSQSGAASNLQQHLAMQNSNLRQNPPSRLGNGVPMHMNKAVSSLHPSAQRKVNNGLAALHGRNKATVSTKGIKKEETATVKPSTAATFDWLQQSITNKIRKNKTSGKPLSAYLNRSSTNDTHCNKRRKVNTDGVGFDGSVPVPKPSKLFQSVDSTTVIKAGSSSLRATAEEKRVQLLQRQAEVARLRQNGPPSSNKKNDMINRMGSAKQKENGTNSSSKDDFLAAMGDFDLEKVRNAKSRFANEIEAEEYAASRRKVIELEKLEERQIARKDKTKEDDKRLTKAWCCKVCGQTYSIKPKSCYNAGHDVLIVRSLRKEKTKEECRTALHSKGSDDGGLQLGAGLEWSNQFSGNRFLR